MHLSHTSMSCLGGSWVVISGVISKITIVLIHIRGLTTMLIATHAPPRLLTTPPPPPKP